VQSHLLRLGVKSGKILAEIQGDQSKPQEGKAKFIFWISSNLVIQILLFSRAITIVSC
jgi:hypothetical protein